MINGTVTELRIGQADQPNFYYASKGKASAADSSAVDAAIWCLSNTSLPIYTTGQRYRRKNGHPGKFCGIYGQVTTYPDQTHKAIVRKERAINQQSGAYRAGRIFSQNWSCQKRRNKLKYHQSMIDCGSKSSLRYIISLYPLTSL